MEVFYERGESRKNFSHAGGMKDSFDRQFADINGRRVPYEGCQVKAC
jgi:hypothetical protein